MISRSFANFCNARLNPSQVICVRSRLSSLIKKAGDLPESTLCVSDL